MHAFVDGLVREPALSDAPGRPEDILTLFFERSMSSQTKGRDFLRRISSRETDRDQPTDLATDLATRNAQLNALSEWGIPDSTLDPPQPAGRHYAANAGRQRR